MNLYSLFLKNYKKNRKIVFGQDVLTYHDFREMVDQISNNVCFLKKKKIAVISKNQKILSVLLFVTAKLDLTLITISENLTSIQINKQLKQIKPDLIICEYGGLLKKIGNYKNKILEKDLFKLSKTKIKKIKKVKKSNLEKDYIITFSSGTTSSPKAVVFTQKIKLMRFLHMKNLYQINKKDTILSVSPIDHSLGQRLLFLALLNGLNFIFTEKYNFAEIKKLVKKYKVSFTILPSNYLSLMKKKLIKKSIFIKKIVSGASSLNSKDKIDLIKSGSKFFEMYGASEVGTVTSFNINKNNKKLNSVGKILKNISIKIVDEYNNFLPYGQTGEIVCKTPLKFKGYYKNNLLTKKSFIKGYFKTGDLGKIDKDSYLYFLSRKKDMIISSGKNIYPIDIEKELLKIQFIKDAAVIGIKDKFFGEVVFSVCVLKNKFKNIESKLRFILSKNLSTHQLPLGYSFVSDLPKNKLGKIQKNILRKKYNNLKLDLSRNLRKILN